ncbi:MAG: serine/threonine protein kinase [Polyangiaceae bacterium]|nr:serine/threonine protein kinase [Polyangiaceae bacterium]
MSSLQAGTLVAGKFQLEREIGSGGMGAVWLAQNTQLDIPVAVKFMVATAVDAPEITARFEREAKAAAQLRSPYVIQIFEHGTHNGLPFIAMEYLEGEDLRQRLKREPKLPMPTVVWIVDGLCRALARAHELSIIHRDLKPANIFLVNQSGHQGVKVLDFGIAKVKRPGQKLITGTGDMMGTPHYMSPEQIDASSQVDHRADLWSVGVLTFRMLTGKLPFNGENMFSVVSAVQQQPLPKASTLAPELGPEVDAFFERALAKNPADRFQTAQELAKATVDLTAVTTTSPAGRKEFATTVKASPDIAALIQPPVRRGVETVPSTIVVPHIGKPRQASAPPAPNRTWLFVTLGLVLFVIVAAFVVNSRPASSDDDLPTPIYPSQPTGVATVQQDAPPAVPTVSAIQTIRVPPPSAPPKPRSPDDFGGRR